jgi:hypothetical protein
MSRHTLPPVVLEFVADHLRSLEELQLLMAVIHAPDRWWDAQTAARELVMPVKSARRALDHLGARNLLDIRITGDVRYQFRPGTTALRSAALACVAAYAADPQALVELLTKPAARPASDFADAFRIRRYDDDDR